MWPVVTTFLRSQLGMAIAIGVLAVALLTGLMQYRVWKRDAMIWLKDKQIASHAAHIEELKLGIEAQNRAIQEMQRAATAMAQQRNARVRDRQGQVERERPTQTAPGHEEMNRWLSEQFSSR